MASGSSRGRWVQAALATLVLAAGFALPPRADAGTYTVAECSAVGTPGNPLAPDATAYTNTTVYPQGKNCPAGLAGSNGLTVTNSGGIGPGTAFGGWQFIVPSGAHFQNISFTFNMKDGSGHSPVIAMYSTTGVLLAVWNGTTPGYVSGNDIPASVQAMQNGGSLVTALSCGGSCPAAPGGAVHTYAWGFNFTIADDTKPTLSSLDGELVGVGTRRGRESLIFSGSDGQGGIRSGSVRVNGTEVDRSTPICSGWDGQGPAYSFSPCPANHDFSFDVDTEKSPWVDGRNTLEVCVHDLAFDSVTALADCETREVLVDNSCPSSGGTQPATSLDAALQSGNGPLRASISTSSARSAVARGTLEGPGSVAGSTVCLYEEVDLPGDGRELVDTAKVRNGGSFALNIDPGPTRTFDVVYRWNNKVAERERLRIDSTVVPVFKIVGRKNLHNGQNVRFRGRIPGPNAEGRGISLQASVGKKWRTFKQVRTGLRGTFKGLYRFTQTVGRASYVFRARVKRQSLYPYEAGHSRRRQVTVAG